MRTLMVCMVFIFYDMCVHTYLHTYVYVFCVFYKNGTCTSMHVCMHVRMVWFCGNDTRSYVYTYMCACRYIRIVWFCENDTRSYVYTYVRMYLCVHAYIVWFCENVCLLDCGLHVCLDVSNQVTPV